MMLFQLRKLPLLLVLTIMIAFVNPAYSDDEFQYFNDPDVNYWKRPEPSVLTTSGAVSPAQVSMKAGSNVFNWKKYLDPKNDEFFKEGDYTPPAPFMEIARNPSDENIQNWFRYLETKNEITRRLQTKLEELTVKSSTLPFAVASTPRVVSLVSLKPDAKRFRLRLYFDSKCPHCEKMMGTLTTLAAQGYWIELKQVDADTAARSHIPFPVSSAEKAELKQYGIESVPVLLVGDLKQGTFFKLTGYQPPTAVEMAIQQSALRANPGGSS